MSTLRRQCCTEAYSCDVRAIYYSLRMFEKNSGNNKVRKSSQTFECQTSSAGILVRRPLNVGIIVVDFFDFDNNRRLQCTLTVSLTVAHAIDCCVSLHG